MNTRLMNDTQQSTTLPQGRAIRVAGAGRARALQVLEGRVWATVTARGTEASEDLALDAGDLMPLGPDDDVVVEGLRHARIQLVEPAAAFSASGASPRGWTLRGWVRRFSFAPAPSVCV